MSVLLEPQKVLVRFNLRSWGVRDFCRGWASRFWSKNANPRHNRFGLRSFGQKSRTPDTNAHPGGLGFEDSTQNRETQPPILEAQARNLEPQPQSANPSPTDAAECSLERSLAHFKAQARKLFKMALGRLRPFPSLGSKVAQDGSLEPSRDQFLAWVRKWLRMVLWRLPGTMAEQTARSGVC